MTQDPSPSEQTGVALCVDLDGTLLKSDLLYESLLALLSKQPLPVFWLLRCQAALEH